MLRRSPVSASFGEGRDSEAQPPIRDYALIGDCHGCALVSRAGSIDWCALLRLDEDPLFFRILDARRGGFWDIVPEGLKSISRAYLPGTNLLRTEFETETGRLAVTDFMPVGRSRDASTHDYVSLNAPGWLVRRFACVRGQVRFTTRFSPRGPRFSTEPLQLHVEDGRVVCPGGLSLWSDGEVAIEDGVAHLRYALGEGEVRDAVLTRIEPLFDPRECGERLFDTTVAFWHEWIEYSRYRGPYEDAVTRSALVLKLLTYAPTGALVAAPTTSLPEEIGGERNWDYRFCWLRDASLALYSLSAIGYSGEAARFSDFVSRRCFREGSTIRVMYGIEGEPFLPERTLDHLAGYRDSRPVRAGNSAAEQYQLDVFGEVLDWADLRLALGGRLSRDKRGFLAGIADHVCRNWRLPDQGLWEVRSHPRDFVHGKAMAWVALDRAARLLGDRPVWRGERERIIAAILQQGCRGDPPHLTRSFDAGQTDAALLQVALLDLPIAPDLMAETVRRVEAELRSGPFVHRYRGEDGLGGGEGAFFITSFWLVDALLMVGRADEARALFEALLAQSNDVGLYSEEIDPATGAFLGNFPQAFTHLALISSATLLHLHETGGRDALRGSHAARARRLVGATQGAKALAYALLRNRKIRLRSSRKSVLALT
jgi:GH15 family glucan-1,4-alpha-glucosidase